MRNAALGFLHLLRNLAAQADDGNGLFAVAFGITCRALGLHLTTRGRMGVQVGVRDASGRATAVHVTQFNAHVQGTLAHRRGC